MKDLLTDIAMIRERQDGNYSLHDSNKHKSKLDPVLDESKDYSKDDKPSKFMDPIFMYY